MDDPLFIPFGKPTAPTRISTCAIYFAGRVRQSGESLGALRGGSSCLPSNRLFFNWGHSVVLPRRSFQTYWHRIARRDRL